MPLRLASAALLFTAACSAPRPAHDATKPPNAAVAAVMHQRPRFAWKAPLSVHVSEDASKDNRSATLSYWLDVCPEPPDRLSVAQRDLRFVTLMGKPATSPEVAPALAQLQPIIAAIPRLIIDARGDIQSVEGLPELIARIRAAVPDAPLADQLQKTLQDPALVQAAVTGAADRWQVWLHAWLTTDPRTIPPSAVITPQRVHLTQTSTARDIPDPNGSGAKLDLTVEINTDTEWPDIRPWTASSKKTAHFTLKGESVTRTETHRYRFDWGTAGTAAECGK